MHPLLALQGALEGQHSFQSRIRPINSSWLIIVRCSAISIRDGKIPIKKCFALQRFAISRRLPNFAKQCFAIRRPPNSIQHGRLHLSQPEERLEDLMEEDLHWWHRQETGGSSERQRWETSERQGEEDEKSRVTETAFLVTRSNQQTLALVLVRLTILI